MRLAKKKKQKFKKRENSLKTGDLVKLNVDRIMAHPDFDELVWEYKQFIKGHRETVFTITNEENRFGIKDLFMLKNGDINYRWLIHVLLHKY